MNSDFSNTSPEQRAIITKYFAEHSPDDVSVKASFIFRLNEDFADNRTEVNGIKTQPNIKGQWSWLNSTTLAFQPEETLDYDQNIKVIMQIDELLQSDDHPSEPIFFNIKTRKLRFDMSLNGLKISNSDEVTIEGTIQTTDYVSPDLVKSIVKVQQSNGNPNLEWNHTSNGQNHSFSIKNINQPESEQALLKVSWDGSKWHKNFTGQEVIAIPAKGIFSIVEVRTESNPEKIIEVYFSRPLQSNQNRNGLISVNGKIKDIKSSADGNVLLIYPSADIEGDINLIVSEKIKSADGLVLNQELNTSVRLDFMDPAVRSVSSGMIIPNTTESYFPLEVVNLKALDIEIFKIFENNILQYLQDNNLNGNYSLEQVGRIVHRQKVEVEEISSIKNKNKWIRIGLDLKKYIENDPASIYQIRVGFQKSYAVTDCEESPAEPVIIKSGEESMITYTNDYYENWENRSDPCHHSYYNPDRVIKSNLIMSDVSVIVKQGGQNQYHLAINSISTGQSINNATATFYDYQQQRISEANSNGSGFINVKTEREASFIVVEHSSGYAYVNLNDQNSNSLSDFEVSGVEKRAGIDGYIYADRGVHRPGDTLFLNFMLDDTGQPIPSNHPVTLEVQDPKGNKKYDLTTSDHIERIYAFKVPTDANALTGQWRATVKVGAQQFTKPLRIETIKPNRLKIEIESLEEISYAQEEERNITLNARWLHGASAAGLKAKVDASFQNIAPSFIDYSSYSFMDPARSGSDALINIYDGTLSENGTAQINIKITPEVFPGKIRANIKARVFENGGNYSESYSSFKISPFSNYVGVRAPENRWGYKSVEIGEEGTFKVVTTDEQGQKVGNKKLSVGVYDIDWRWWYYQGERYNIYRLNSAQHKEAFFTTSITTSANGEYDLKIDFQDVEYGRKLIRICDEVSGHCTGEFFYAQGWSSPDLEEERESLSKLIFTSDKSSYNKGEKVKISIPSEKGSRILISLETGDDVIFKEWIEGEERETVYEFTTTSEMTPNVYVHAIMMQSYDEKSNDLPFRMYGVIPIEVEDKNTVLNPVLKMADSLEPKETFTVEVSEEDAKAMAYTIAIVDEGLLDLTNFGTPDPHDHFFAKQALGVKTWDLYQYIMTGINGSVDKIISVGGDDDGTGGGGVKKAIRFKPVVMTAGPYYIHNGESRSHTFTMPNYIGSVRAMVVAKIERSYGSADETIPVKKDLMILPTMPRVLGPGEIVHIPVSVFANESHIKNVTARIETSPNLELISNSSQQISFSKTGEKLIYFKAKVKDDIGIAKVNISATSGNSSINQELELDIRNPNPYESKVLNQVIQPGDTWSTTIDKIGTTGTNEGIIELSAVPPMNLEKRLDYLTSYPYGCLEQTVSSAFPQLSLDKVIDIDFNRKKKIDKNINAAIRRVSKLQKSNGGMAYWPGGNNISAWGTTYAGHFLIKAKDNGYYIPNNLLSSWSKYQSRRAREFRIDRSQKRWYQQWQMKDQAYRLYTLSLNGNAELPSMNVLRQEIDLPPLCKYLLAAAYAHAGKSSVALDMIKNVSTDIAPYNELGYTYGSDLRDMAIIAQTLMTLDKTQQAGQVVKRIADKLNSNKWYSTQTLAHALSSVSDFVGEYERDNLKFTMQVADGDRQQVDYSHPVFLYSFDPDQSESKEFTITNTSEDVLFAKVTMSGKKSITEALSSNGYNRNIHLEVNYVNLDGKTIDPTRLERGTDFIAHVRIKNQNSRGNFLNEMALSQIFPSGWEIQSGGISNLNNAIKEDQYEYRDVRDDRVYTFFDLADKKEYKVLLTAAYDGEYYLPPVSCEAMYDNEIQAKTKGRMVSVVPPHSENLSAANQ